MIEHILWMVVGAVGVLGMLACYTLWVIMRQENTFHDEYRIRRDNKHRCHHKWQG